MFLILQETVFQDQMLKSSSLSKKQTEKCKFIKARHLLDTSYLSRFKKETEILICFLGIRECVFRTSFLLTLDIQRDCFKSRQRVHKFLE